MSSTEVPSDADLIHDAQQGDLVAFDALMERHLHEVRVFVALKAPVAELMDEVTHETFVFAYQRLREFHEGSFQGWLRAIAFQLIRRRVLLYSREQRNLERYGEHARWEAAQRVLHHKSTDDAERLAVCLEELPPPMRELLELRYRDGMTCDEVAKRLQRTGVWARQVLTRLRRKLKECMEQQQLTTTAS
jgi:RNA polymerase sigma-70 factor (ECF subfamily)